MGAVRAQSWPTLLSVAAGGLLHSRWALLEVDPQEEQWYGCKLRGCPESGPTESSHTLLQEASRKASMLLQMTASPRQGSPLHPGSTWHTPSPRPELRGLQLGSPSTGDTVTCCPLPDSMNKGRGASVCPADTHTGSGSQQLAAGRAMLTDANQDAWHSPLKWSRAESARDSASSASFDEG